MAIAPKNLPPITLNNTVDIKVPWTHWFLYGDTGAGKTTIASTFPSPLFLVPKNESSVTTLAGRKYQYILITDRSSPFKPKRGPDDFAEGGMDSVLDMLETYFAHAHKTGDFATYFPWETIVVESLTHYCDLVQDELTEHGTVVMDMPRYGKLAGHLRSIQVRLRNIDAHCVFTALARTDDGKEGGPAIPGQTAEKLPASCDVIGYVEVTDLGKDKPQRHTLYTRKRKAFFARSRFPNLPPEIQNFKFDAIKKALTSVSSVEVEAEGEPDTTTTTDAKTGD